MFLDRSSKIAMGGRNASKDERQVSSISRQTTCQPDNYVSVVNSVHIRVISFVNIDIPCLTPPVLGVCFPLKTVIYSFIHPPGSFNIMFSLKELQNMQQIPLSSGQYRLYLPCNFIHLLFLHFGCPSFDSFSL